MDTVRKLVRADEAYKQGFTGKGICVAVLDSGIKKHPDFEPFSEKVQVFKDYVNNSNLVNSQEVF